MPKWTIRRAKNTDAKGLAECVDEAYSIYAQRISDLPAVSEHVEEDIGNNMVWVALVDGRIVGGVILMPRSDHAVLANVAVRPSMAGLGLGRSLMQVVEAESRRLGLARLQLTTHSEMPANVVLYKRLGWIETKRSGNKIHMEKALIS